jgi:uncharacterized protein (TIGR02996 family)
VDEQALLRAILADPADDTVRLAYADWLDEHAEADRAAFIRVQIELARLPEADPRRTALREREAELFEVLRQERLSKELPAESARYGGQYCGHYRRGFLANISLEVSSETVAEFRALAPALFALSPVEELTIVGAVSQANWNDYWNGTRSLDYLATEPVRELADVPELARLSILNAASPASDIDAICRAIIASPHLRNLRQLHILNRYPSFETLNGLNDGGTDEFLVDPIAAETQAELRAAFGDRVTWDA